MYPQAGTYQSPYQLAPLYGPPQNLAPQVPPGYYYPPPAPMGAPMDNSFITALIPLLLTLPGLRTGQVNAQALQTALAAITPPAALQGGPPSQLDFNALLDYTKKIKDTLVNTLGNDTTVFSSLRQGALMQAMFGMMGGGGGGGGNNAMLFFVLAFSLGGGF
jgi:hypothetical protein